MLFSKTIRQFIALAMLVVFAFSITPQQIIHDAVAKHLDPTICEVHKDVPLDQVENTRLHCSFDFQVATAPFIYYDFAINILEPFTHVTRFITYVQFTLANNSFGFDSRGPPTV